MRLLITGGCGFIGSNFVRFVLEHYQQEFVSNVDALTYAPAFAPLARARRRTQPADTVRTRRGMDRHSVD